jgi:hypothetical protein
MKRTNLTHCICDIVVVHFQFYCFEMIHFWRICLYVSPPNCARYLEQWFSTGVPRYTTVPFTPFNWACFCFCEENQDILVVTLRLRFFVKVFSLRRRAANKKKVDNHWSRKRENPPLIITVKIGLPQCMYDVRGQFHQHFMSSFCAEILAQKDTNLKVPKNRAWNIRTKKPRVKCWWNWPKVGNILGKTAMNGQLLQSNLKDGKVTKFDMTRFEAGGDDVWKGHFQTYFQTFGIKIAFFSLIICLLD